MIYIESFARVDHASLMGKLMHRMADVFISRIEGIGKVYMKKILFLTTQFPYPLDNGGKIGAYNGLDSLADNELILAAFSEQMELVEEGKEVLHTRWKNIRSIKVIKQDVHIQRKPFLLAIRIIQSYFGKLPYMAVKFSNPNMYKYLDKIMQENYFDAVFIDYLNMYPYGEYIRKKYKDKYGLYILKDHNIEFEIFRQTSSRYKGVKKLLTNPIWLKTKAYELNAVKNSDIVFSVCESNTKFFRKFNEKSFTMKPTLDILPEKGKVVNNKKILYIGNLSWLANMNGVKWFVDKVLPLVKDKIPDVSLTIIGSGDVQNPYTDNDSVEWLGYVSDISEVYEGYRIFIVPLFEGSGIRIKILEAFNNEIPVVSTSMACETIGAEKGKEILIADSEVQFAKDIISLMTDNTLCRQITDNAKRFLRDNFSVISRRLEMKEVLDRYM